MISWNQIEKQAQKCVHKQTHTHAHWDKCDQCMCYWQTNREVTVKPSSLKDTQSYSVTKTHRHTCAQACGAVAGCFRPWAKSRNKDNIINGRKKTVSLCHLKAAKHKKICIKLTEQGHVCLIICILCACVCVVLVCICLFHRNTFWLKQLITVTISGAAV